MVRVLRLPSGIEKEAVISVGSACGWMFGLGLQGVALFFVGEICSEWIAVAKGG